MGRHAGAVAHLSGHSHRRQHELSDLPIRGRVATDPSPLKRYLPVVLAFPHQM